MFAIESIVGTASGHKYLLIFIFKEFVISAFTVFAESAKCVKHSTQYFWGMNYGFMVDVFEQIQSTYLASPFLSYENDAAKHRLYID